MTCFNISGEMVSLRFRFYFENAPFIAYLYVGVIAVYPLKFCSYIYVNHFNLGFEFISF